MRLSRNVERVWGIPRSYYWQRNSGGGDKKSSLLGRQASQTAFRLPLKRENPCPFLVCRKKAGVKSPANSPRTGSARRKIGECRICKLGSKISFIQKYGVKILKSAHQRLYLGKYGWRQRTKNNVNTAHRREKKSGSIGDYILN